MTAEEPAIHSCPACSKPAPADSAYSPFCGHRLAAGGSTLAQPGHAAPPPDDGASATIINPADPGTHAPVERLNAGPHATIIKREDTGTRPTILRPPDPGTRATIIQGPSRPAAINPADGAGMVDVTAGEFLMGSDDSGEDEKPQRQVYLDCYWIYQTPVTVVQYRRFCQAARREMPDPPPWGWKEDHPIVNVTWHDAAAYAEWARAALPTEAQWEKAARGTDGRKFPWGNDWDNSRLQCSRSRWGDANSTAPAGNFPAGASPYGALDMAGNVWEWCADWHDFDYYTSAPARNPAGPDTGQCRAVRGGSWDFLADDFFRCAFRGSFVPAVRDNNSGFRCVIRADL